jgi:hypothetical protein
MLKPTVGIELGGVVSKHGPVQHSWVVILNSELAALGSCVS